MPKKKKKSTAKTVRTTTTAADANAEYGLGTAVIDAEDTLAMIKNALKSGTGRA